MTRVRIPSRFIRVAPQRKTVSTRNSRNGMFTGRRVVQGQGDKTQSVYLTQDYDVNHDGRIGPNEHGGTIQGRTFNPKSRYGKTQVKASRRARGYERRV